MFLQPYEHIIRKLLDQLSIAASKNPNSGQLSIAASKNPSVMNTICINSFRYNVITRARLRLKQVRRLTKEKTEMKREH